MVQVLAAPKTFGSEFGEAIGKGLGSLAGGYIARHQRTKEQEREDKFYKEKYGIDLPSGTEARKEFVKEFAKKEADVAVLKSSFPKLFSQNASGVSQEKVDQLSGRNTQGSQSQEGFDLENMSPQERAALTLYKPELGKQALEEEKFKYKKQSEEREPERKRAYKVIEEADEARKTLPQRRTHINMSEAAIKEGEIGGMDQDFLADMFNYNPLRTAKGVQTKAAMKDLFIQTIKGAGSRPNQWIEQQIQSAMVQIGNSAEANLTVLELAKFKLDLEEKRLDIIDQLEDEYRRELGHIPGTIGKDADKLLKPYVEQRQKELAYDLREIYEREMGPMDFSKIKKVPKGTPLTLEKARQLDEKYGDNAEKVAKKLGYEIPEESIYSREK